MPPTCNNALAVDFDHTSAAPDVVLTFSAGTTPVNVTLATGPYRMCLAPAATDYLRALESAINTAITGASHVDSNIAVTLSAAGVVTVTVVDEEDSELVTLTLSAAIAARLGLPTLIDTGGVTWAFVGTRPVWHLALFTERVSADWQQRTAVASAETAGGVGYGVTSGITRWQDELTFGFIPRDPTFGTSLGVSQTPWEPDAAYLTALGTVGARAYSVSDLLAGALGKTCAFAAGNFQALRTSTGERYHLVTIPGRECGAPRLARLRAGWDAYRRWTTMLIRQSTPTGTRA